ncbi:MAG: type II methionyl aminopeptidase [Hyperthermus sp.]|nr:MAG: type II methionyl aminopeptidase [Hyperthermus sp.]
MEGFQEYVLAGKIASKVRENVTRTVKPGLKLIDICNMAEYTIRELGGQPAFPCNISINHIAAHYTPLINDEMVVPEESVVKIDIGVHVNGYIADTAITINFNDKYAPLVEAVREALDKAIETVRPGAPFSVTGKAIESTIKGYGFKPIVNLGGHSLGRFRVHAGESIPNVYDPLVTGRYEKGKAYAIEPFGTTGRGVVYEERLTTIYALVRPNLKRRLDPTSRKLLYAIMDRFKSLPFTERWLSDVVNDVKTLRRTLERLAKMGFLMKYPVLVERSGSVVAQFEHTVLVSDSGEVIVTTL